jgi:hypothetical protein
MKAFCKYCLLLNLVTLFVFILAAESKAQITDPTNTESGIRGAPRVYKFSARTTALGNATVAGIHDLMAINMNPASLAFVKNLNAVQLNIYQNWNNNLMLENIAFPLFASSQHTFAGQIGLHHGGITATNFLGTSPLPQPSITMYQIDLAYAYTIDGVLSLGIMNNISFAQNNNNSQAQYWTSFITLGLLYSPSQSVSYGLSFRGLGRSVTYRFISGGRTALVSQNLREVLELGATMRFPVNTRDPYMVISMANEKKFGLDGIWYKAGVDARPWPFLSIRAGIMIQSATEVVAPRFGIGIIGDNIELDYAISYDNDLYERFHQLTLTLHLGQ